MKKTKIGKSIKLKIIYCLKKRSSFIFYAFQKCFMTERTFTTFLVQLFPFSPIAIFYYMWGFFFYL